MNRKFIESIIKVAERTGYLQSENERLEARLAELEKGKAEPDIKECSICAYENYEQNIYPCNYCGTHSGRPKWEPKAEPEQWEPKSEVYLDSEDMNFKELKRLCKKATPYILQLQWLFEHYPEETGEWSEETRHFLYYDEDNKEWDISVELNSPTLNLILMSYKAAEHLAADMNIGKVRF